ncbi:phosphodiesterase [Cereibacter sphaeroides]|uniref:glycerophosphodiester phosphodiesterase family protein n=1 Tax=Cereibacter sphaeroides TaxID=1063 RepID=UPI000B73655F|nr:glycerophosphodiester phosphodiesterase family protein [Cereibacter sphaeroides]AZB54274.1 phosphodiesterase [Cereibacter sphaeroides]AZB58537.1 phosphodiesterase [Cereibacter sphaeroides]SNS58208.1 Glycerophosphoryl diester phosphodiesterase [[Luteovulum] sphaeroides subsp. megalophilum]
MRAPLPEAFLRLPIAHRALHDRAAGRPENSPGAIRAAVEAGYGIEIDLQLSADGVPMVFHDESLDRLTAETGPLAARTAAELRTIPLRDATDTIPTLAEVLALVAGRAPLLIEIKDQDGALGPAVGALEAATAAALDGYGGPVAVMSFNPQSMAEMARLRPDLPRGLVTSSYDPTDWAPVPPETCARLRAIPDYDRVEASFVSHEAPDLDRPRVAELKAQGAAILCWTIRSPEAEALARRVAANVTFEGYRAALPA